MTEREDFKCLIQKVVDAYGNKFTINQRIFDLWYKHIGAEYRLEVIETAMDKFIDTSSYAPVIADIKRLCDEQMQDAKTEDRYINSIWQQILDCRPNHEATAKARKHFDEYLQAYDNRLEQARKVFGWVKAYEGEKTLEGMMEALCQKSKNQ